MDENDTSADTFAALRAIADQQAAAVAHLVGVLTAFHSQLVAGGIGRKAADEMTGMYFDALLAATADA